MDAHLLRENKNYSFANLEGADLEGADLEGANLRGANLEGANLTRANLRVAYLRVAYLEGANLEGANLEGAYLEGADLEGADLRDANLRDANLRDANLTGANLEGAYLTAEGEDPSKERLLKLLSLHITTEFYDQSEWCGTNCCLAGAAGASIGNQSMGVALIAKVIPEFDISVLYTTKRDQAIKELERVRSLQEPTEAPTNLGHSSQSICANALTE